MLSEYQWTTTDNFKKSKLYYDYGPFQNEILWSALCAH